MTYDMSLNHRDTLYDERTGTFLALRESVFIPKAPVGRNDVINLIGRKGIRIFRYSVAFANNDMIFKYRDLGDMQSPPREYMLEVYSKYEDLNKRWKELRGAHSV